VSAYSAVAATSEPSTLRWGRGRTLHRALREIPLVAVLYLAYVGGRILASHHTGEAFHHAEDVWHFERLIGLPSEHSLQQLALHSTLLVKALGIYYAKVHFPATIAVLVWLFLRRPEAYPWFRWTLALLTGFGLVGHIFFPLAPPRMLTDHGMLDTGKLFGESVYGAVGSGVANQFAAMPSLHVGWAVLIAIALITTLKSKWRWLAVAHPVITVAVVVITGNHYWLDGIVACLLLVLALALTRSLYPAAAASAGAEHAAGPVLVLTERLVASTRAHAWSLVRFVTVGAAATLVGSALFLLVVLVAPVTVANGVAVVVSTLLANEAHRWWTFRSDRQGVMSRVAAAGTVVLAYVITSGAQILLTLFDDDPSTHTELVVLVLAQAVAGLIRYALLGTAIFPSAPPAHAEVSASDTVTATGTLADAEGVPVGDTVPAEWVQGGTGSPASTASRASSMARSSTP
jgi:putative flippase GtrA